MSKNILKLKWYEIVKKKMKRIKFLVSHTIKLKINVKECAVKKNIKNLIKIKEY